MAPGGTWWPESTTLSFDFETSSSVAEILMRNEQNSNWDGPSQSAVQSPKPEQHSRRQLGGSAPLWD